LLGPRLCTRELRVDALTEILNPRLQLRFVVGT